MPCMTNPSVLLLNFVVFMSALIASDALVKCPRPTRPNKSHLAMQAPLFASGVNKNSGKKLLLGVGGTILSLGRRKLIFGVGGTVLSIPILAEAYSRGLLGGSTRTFPDRPFQEESKSWKDIEDVTIVFHGAGGEDPYTEELMTRLLQSDTKTSYATMINWSESSKDILQASFNGEWIGRRAASKLQSRVGNIKSLHVIGISVGAFAADSCVTRVKERLVAAGRDREDVHVQLTLLDPFAQRGVFGIGYGNRQFGKSADYAQQFLNTDDPVPSTNDPCSNCAVTDVTGIRPPEIFGHDWPLVYYARNVNTGLVPLSEQRQAGDVIHVSTE